MFFCYFFACGALLRPCFRRLQIRYVSDLFSRIKIKRFRFYFWTKTNFRFIDDLWWDLSTNQLRFPPKSVFVVTETPGSAATEPPVLLLPQVAQTHQKSLNLWIFRQNRLKSMNLLKHPPTPGGGIHLLSIRLKSRNFTSVSSKFIEISRMSFQTPRVCKCSFFP